MANLNIVMLMGNLGNDPELRFTPKGNPVCTFRIAVNRNYTTAEGERKQETEWVNIVTWNKLAERCNEFLAKGRNVYLSGSLRTRSWDQDGQRRSRTEVVAREMQFLDKGLAKTQSSNGGGSSIEDEDFPWED